MVPRVHVAESHGLTHVTRDGTQAGMVDVGDKEVTTRRATARAHVYFRPHVAAVLATLEEGHVVVDAVDPVCNPLLGGSEDGVGDGGVVEEKRVAKVEGKGPVFGTAVIAATMGVKSTSSLIPLCHPLPIQGVEVELGLDLQAAAVVIECSVRVEGKTGVEMEALTGASIAALTVYDMTKALDHYTVIGDIALHAKSGGKSLFHRQP